MGRSVIVCDEGALFRCAFQPVVPDAAVSGPVAQAGAADGDDRLAAGNGGNVHQPQHLRSARRVLYPPPQRGLQRRERLEGVVVLAVAQLAGEQVPDPDQGDAQPVPRPASPRRATP